MPSSALHGNDLAGSRSPTLAAIAVPLLVTTIALAAWLRGWAGAAPPPVPRPARFVGVNLGSGAFAPERVPGVYGSDYIYPDREIAAPFREAGMTAVRVPVVWERLQDRAFGPLVESEMARLDASLRQLGGFTLVILDVHNSASYRGLDLGQPGAPGAMLADLWSKLAMRYRGNPRIAFGLMNEPHDIDARTWRAIAEQTLAAIRAAGARNLVLVSGTRWDGAHSWLEGGGSSNAAAFAGFRDPGNNFAFEFHDYLDANSSGTGDCFSEQIGAQRLVAATGWLRANQYRGFLGEFGVWPNALCLRALDAMLGQIDRNSDVWMGWTYWAAGPGWGEYPFSVQPDGPTPKPQMAVLMRHVAPRAADY